MRDGLIGSWAIALGALSAPIILATTLLALRLAGEGDDEDYPIFAGFELEDGIYLIGPIVWLGWIEPFFLLGSVGVILFGMWTGYRYLRSR